VQIQPNESHRSPRDDPVKLCRFLTDRDSTSDDFQLHIVVLGSTVDYPGNGE
jgi:hypothetical protein